MFADLPVYNRNLVRKRAFGRKQQLLKSKFDDTKA